MRGKLITLEGIEGAGKSTALIFIRDYLVKVKKEVVLTREPGGTALAEEIRQVLLYPASNEKMTEDTELLLVFASRAQHIAACLLPALQAGKWVVSDRYIDASYAYQGGGRQIESKKIQELDRLVVGELYPDLTLILDVPVELGLARAAERGGRQDRIEQEKAEFFTRVRRVYLQRAEAEPERIRIIDASLPLAAVQGQIMMILNQFIGQ